MPVDRVGTCVGCRETKRIKARGLCTACYNRWWSGEHREEVRAGNERWRTENPEALQASRRKRVRDPLKRKAQTAVANAIRDGKLQRQPCEVCGAEFAEAHHPDYTKPFEIRWLCPEEHRGVHLKPVFKVLPGQQGSGRMGTD
jgi:hypothetical protein